VAARMNEKALYYVEMLLKAAEVVNRRSSGRCFNYYACLGDVTAAVLQLLGKAAR